MKELTPLEELLNLLSQFFKDSELTESDWANGYAIKPEGFRWTWLTVYVAGAPGKYTLYEAIPDTMRGIDIEDEKLIKRGDLDVIRGELTRLLKDGERVLKPAFDKKDPQRLRVLAEWLDSREVALEWDGINDGQVIQADLRRIASVIEDQLPRREMTPWYTSTKTM